MSFIWNTKKRDQNCTLSLCKCVCANMAHIMQCGQVTITDQRVWRKNRWISKSWNICFPPFSPQTARSLYCCIKSVFTVQDVLCVCLWSFANLHLQLFPSQAVVKIAVTTALNDTRDMIGFYWCRSSMWSLFSTLNFDVSCSTEQTVLRGGREICSKDFFFTWFWYHVA